MQSYVECNTEAIRILSDPEYYQLISYDFFPSLQKSMEALITEAQENKVITKKEVISL